MNQDAEHLRLLSIFHYVYAGLIALGSCAALFPIFFGFAALTGGLHSREMPPAVVGGFVIAVGVAVFLFALVMAALTFYAGQCLADRKHHTFCIVIAAISCLSFPFGTALGVFTIVVLQRASVRAMFLKAPTPPA